MTVRIWDVTKGSVLKVLKGHTRPIWGLALTPDGRVLTYGTNGVGTQTGYFIYDIWDPTAGPAGGHVTLDNMTQTDIFCSSQIILPQSGQILISGGDNWTGTGTTNTGNNRSNLFDFTDNSLTGLGTMNRARGYSSSTALINGEVYIRRLRRRGFP
jgi:WD40 repeat protein